MNFLRVKVLSMWAVIPERYNLYVRRMSLSRELQRVKLIPLSGCQAPLVLSLFLSQSSSVALALIQPQMLSVVVWLGFVACSIIANCICIIRRHNVYCAHSHTSAVVLARLSQGGAIIVHGCQCQILWISYLDTSVAWVVLGLVFVLCLFS